MLLKEKLIPRLPDCEGALVILSGGLDSSIASRLCVEKYGASNVHAISFFYQQKQAVELECAKRVASHLGLAAHSVHSLDFFGDIVRPVCSNISKGPDTPTITDVIGDPAPPTEVPFRNGVLIMIAAAYAQVNELGAMIIGVQAQDEYFYFDTTPAFIGKMAEAIHLNRMHKIDLIAPWKGVNKREEIQLLLELDGNVDLLGHTMSCYDPIGPVSCGNCPSCADRLGNFAKVGVKDPIPYAIEIPWDELFAEKRGQY